MDDHIWWSVFMRPLRSRFGRAQRVSLCMAMIMLTMFANALFYGTLPDRITNGIFGLGVVSFDPVDVSGICDLVLTQKKKFLMCLDWSRTHLESDCFSRSHLGSGFVQKGIRVQEEEKPI